jgi:uncharacterized protein YxeA
MKKIVTIVIGIILLAHFGVIAFAESNLTVATPQSQEKSKEQPAEQVNDRSSSTPDNVWLSKRNKAKLELEQQKKMKQDQIDKEKAAEAAQQ